MNNNGSEQKYGCLIYSLTTWVDVNMC